MTAKFWTSRHRIRQVSCSRICGMRSLRLRELRLHCTFFSTYEGTYEWYWGLSSQVSQYATSRTENEHFWTAGIMFGDKDQWMQPYLTAYITCCAKALVGDGQGCSHQPTIAQIVIALAKFCFIVGIFYVLWIWSNLPTLMYDVKRWQLTSHNS